MNAGLSPRAIAVPVSFLVALLSGHEGLAAKDDVKWTGPKGEKVSLSLMAALYRSKWAVEQSGFGPFVVTSVFEGGHMEGSFHNSPGRAGNAGDIRTNHVDANAADAMLSIIGEAVGPGFDVIREKDHIHLEHDPRSANAAGAWLGER